MPNTFCMCLSMAKLSIYVIYVVSIFFIYFYFSTWTEWRVTSTKPWSNHPNIKLSPLQSHLDAYSRGTDDIITSLSVKKKLVHFVERLTKQWDASWCFSELRWTSTTEYVSKTLPGVVSNVPVEKKVVQMWFFRVPCNSVINPLFPLQCQTWVGFRRVGILALISQFSIFFFLFFFWIEGEGGASMALFGGYFMIYLPVRFYTYWYWIPICKFIIQRESS